MAKYPTFALKGTTKYARFWEPDSVSGKYQSTVIVENDEAAQAVIQTIQDTAADQHTKDYKAGKVNLNFSVTDEGFVAFKLRTAKKPRLVDSRGNDIEADPKMGDGTVVKVKGVVLAGGFGAAQKRSVMLIPNAIMVVHLERYRGSDDFGDDEIEGGFVAASTAATRNSEIIDDMNDEVSEPKLSRRNIDF
ncbi:hypothetical protein UFOVP345_1 [uncultured Caudovirales phage]|uniref:Single-stranded DNA-binding protein n=1 Tax=uncultured Caudovirales phage TaxID=2100421 RepID=A0A6J5P0Q2_9CAUD|nr:hypothetical protein UFOVP345_1 [uncultured Caudovirales phage]CAB4161074.1 hypothetical protein UFOVP732_30 [uncultured Caudovirales phage]